jgi:signal transduction histidine kinase
MHACMLVIGGSVLQKASERLSRNKNKIMQLWLARMQREIKAAHSQGALALNNSLDEFLDKIIHALSLTIPPTAEQSKIDREELIQFAQSHGETRASMKSYTIESLILEFHILRQTICDVLEEEEPLDGRAREIITSIIEQAVNDAAARYSHVLRAIRERLTATLVHDLRNPIAAAKMSAQLVIHKTSDSTNSDRQAKRIIRSLDRVSAMIEDVLDASRLGAGETITLSMAECHMEELLKLVAAEYNQDGTNQVHISSSGNVSGYWNAHAIQRIVENLVTNAIKYGAPHEPISVSAVDSDDTITLTVHNHGPAIPEEEQDLLFQRFQRARNTEAQSGWGLGLVIVKGLTEAHGGTVHVESGRDGTSFIVSIPRDLRAKAVEVPQQEAV